MDVIWGKREAKYFCGGGLDWWNRVDLVQEISRSAHLVQRVSRGRNPRSWRFMTADHDPRYELDWWNHADPTGEFFLSPQGLNLSASSPHERGDMRDQRK